MSIIDDDFDTDFDVNFDVNFDNRARKMFASVCNLFVNGLPIACKLFTNELITKSTILTASSQ